MANRIKEKDNPYLRTVLAGISSMCAAFSTHPIDTIKIRMQKDGEGGKAGAKYRNIFVTANAVYKQEGFFALYKGLYPSLLREATYSSLRLGLYEPFKQLLGANNNNKASLFQMLGAGLLSGTVGAIFGNPLDLFYINIQLSQKTQNNCNHTISSELQNIVKFEGVKGLFRGLLPNVLRAAILTATQMATYDKTKQVLKNKFKFEEGMQLYLPCAIITGLNLAITTAPMDLMKTRIMSQEAGVQIYTGILDCAQKTYQKEGISAFYKGFFPQWCRMGPFMIIQFVVWERLRTQCGISNI